MTTVPRNGSARCYLLVCLLFAAQWTGAVTVLCISGPGHVEVETASERCCAPASSGTAGMSAETGSSCAGCTDLPMQAASLRDEFGKQHGNDGFVALPARSPSDLVLSPAPSGSFPDSAQASVPGPLLSAAPLRC